MSLGQHAERWRLQPAQWCWFCLYAILNDPGKCGLKSVMGIGCDCSALRCMYAMLPYTYAMLPYTYGRLLRPVSLNMQR